MKFLLSFLFLATLAQARPRFLVIPVDDYYGMGNMRMARAAWPQDSLGPAGGGFVIPDNIRAAEEQIASGR